MSDTQPADPSKIAEAIGKDHWESLRLPHYNHDHPPVRNAAEVTKDKLTPLDRFAIKITDKVGSVGFFLLILAWTAVWCGYNILASEFKGLHWKSFDPFPAFVAYLLMSNVIQILLMPLIMVGQNLQSRQSDIRGQLDFEINQKAEQEVSVVLKHMEHNTELLIQLMRHLDCHVSDEALKIIRAEEELADKIVSAKPSLKPEDAALLSQGGKGS